MTLDSTLVDAATTSSSTTKLLAVASTTFVGSVSTTKVITTINASTTPSKVASLTTGVSCALLPINLSRRQELSEVKTLQSFLSEKGFLQALPNGYFGVGTISAVKSFQKSHTIRPTGFVGKKTREAIAKETCIRKLSQQVEVTTFSTTTTHRQIQSPLATTTIKLPSSATTTKVPLSVSTTTISVATTTAIKSTTIPTITPSTIRNTKRKEDIGLLLKSLYTRYSDSRGVAPVAITGTPIELCVPPPIVTSLATTTEVAVLETPVSPCLTYVDVSYLSPSYIPTIPRDPLYATTSTLLGYTITRSEYNDITITAKSPEDGAIIKVTCNYNALCKDVKYISNTVYKKPSITSFSRSSFLRDSTFLTPIIITGKNFTGNNSIKLMSNYTSKEYILGTVSSTDGVSISLTPLMLNQLFSCGTTCTEKLPLGDYSISVTNEGGESNNFYITAQGYTTSTVSTHGDISVIPKSTSVKVATITLGTSITLGIKSLVLTSTSSVSTLPSKITNFVLKEQSSGLTRATGAATLTFPDEKIYENNSKVYDLYIDAGEALAGDGGAITYGGYFSVTDPFFSLDMTIPIKEFAFSVSY